MEQPPADWGRVTHIEAGQVMHDNLAVMLRIQFQRPTLPGRPVAPVESTLPLYLTTQQAKDLLLLLGHTLGLPGTGIPSAPAKPKH
jgi:hypothetical protein